jgi:hypothetical protein
MKAKNNSNKSNQLIKSWFLYMPLLLALGVFGCSGDSSDSSSATLPNTKGEAKLIETDNAGHALNPQIAFDSNGNAMAVWQQDDGTRTNIWANSFDSSTNTWQTAELIEIDNAGDAFSPQIAFDSNGNAMAVWSQDDGTQTNIWANRFDSSTNTWGTAELIEADAGSAFSPQIAFDSNGNAMAVWSQDDGTQTNIWANRFDSSTNTWGTAELIEADAGSAFSPQIAFDSNGNAMAVWYQHDGTRTNILANRFDSSTNTWGTAELIETDDAGNAEAPQIAFDSNGNAMAVWQQENSSQKWDIWANRFNSGNTIWGTAVLIETGTGGGYDPQIAIDSNDKALVVWNQYEGNPVVGSPNNVISRIWMNHFNGTSWGTALRIDNGTGGGAFRQQISIDINNNAIVVWHQKDANNHDIRSIWANHFNGDTNNWGTAVLIESGEGNANSPQIAIDSNDKALVVWWQLDDGLIANIWANYFSYSEDP